MSLHQPPESTPVFFSCITSRYLKRSFNPLYCSTTCKYTITKHVLSYRNHFYPISLSTYPISLQHAWNYQSTIRNPIEFSLSLNRDWIHSTDKIIPWSVMLHPLFPVTIISVFNHSRAYRLSMDNLINWRLSQHLPKTTIKKILTWNINVIIF